jgi:hypothetical protein
VKKLGPAALKLGIVVLASGVFFSAQKPVHAQSGEGALVLHDCPDMTTFHGQSDGYEYAVCADIVFAPSGNVNATFHGSLVDPTTAPSSAVIVRDFPCAYGSQETNDSEVVITPDGSVNGRCELHPK